MNKPFFSIILPTKNRPALLRDAISSVLLQNFNDYELIISDNFNDERTKNVIDEFRSNPHLRYFRAESELNIPDHWEFAAKKAKGVYTLIITDRAFLRQGSLRDIHRTITEAKDAPVIFWKYGYFNEKSGALRGEKEEAGVKILKSSNLLKNFSRTLDAHYLPRPHVGCYRFDIAQKIRQNIGRLYLPFSPDYTSSLLLLAYSDFAMYLPRPLVFFQGASVSSGTRAQVSVVSYLKSLNLSDPYKYVPIKAPININLIFNDFLKIHNLAGGNFKNIDIDWVFYFGIVYQELIEKKIIWGVDKKVQSEPLEEWAKALALFDKQFQMAVKKELRKSRINVVKSYIRKTFMGDFLVKIKRAFLGKPTRFYSNVLEAGGFC